MQNTNFKYTALDFPTESIATLAAGLLTRLHPHTSLPSFSTKTSGIISTCPSYSSEGAVTEFNRIPF